MAITREQFLTAVLRGLGVPVTHNNLLKLAAIAVQEGSGGTYNPFNYVVGPGTNFNSVGVKNYPDAQTGITQTIKLLSQKNTSALRSNLVADGSYQDFLAATSRFYNSWGGGNINISVANAEKGLASTVKGSGPGDAGAAIAQSGGGLRSSYDPADPLNWKGIAADIAAGRISPSGEILTTSSYQIPAAKAPAMNAPEERTAFESYLKTLPAEDQARIIGELKQGRSLEEVSQYMAGAPAEVNRYINFLSTLDTSGQNAEKNMLAAPDAQGSAEMTDLLRTLGVSYPNAPQPTPALLAFLKGIGLNMSSAADVKQRALDRIGAATSDAMNDIDRSAGRSKQNVTADLIRRNVLSSGEANTRYARQAEDVGVQQRNVQTTAANTTEQVSDAYEQARSLARQQALDRVIGAEQDQAVSKASSAAQEDAYRRQQAAAEESFRQQLTAQQESVKQQEDLMARQAAQGFAS